MREQADAAEQLACSRRQTELTLQDSQCAHDCRVEEADSIDQLNAQ